MWKLYRTCLSLCIVAAGTWALSPAFAADAGRIIVHVYAQDKPGDPKIGVRHAHVEISRVDSGNEPHVISNFTKSGGLAAVRPPQPGVYRVLIWAHRDSDSMPVRSTPVLGLRYVRIEPDASGNPLRLDAPTRDMVRLFYTSEAAVKEGLAARCGSPAFANSMKELKRRERYYSVALAELNQLFHPLVSKNVRALAPPTRKGYHGILRQSAGGDTKALIGALWKFSRELREQIKRLEQVRATSPEKLGPMISQQRLQELRKDVQTIGRIANTYSEKDLLERGVQGARAGLAKLSESAKAHNAKCAKPPKKKKKCAGDSLMGNVDCVGKKIDQQ